LLDETGVVLALVERLESAGARVTTVAMSKDGSYSGGAGRYRIDASDPVHL